MIPLRSIPTLAIALASLGFTAWAELSNLRQTSPYAASASAPMHAHAHRR